MNHIPTFIAGGLIPEALRGHSGRPQVDDDLLTEILQVPRKMMKNDENKDRSLMYGIIFHIDSIPSI